MMLNYFLLFLTVIHNSYSLIAADILSQTILCLLVLNTVTLLTISLKKYKIKSLLFSVNTKYISSCELKTSEFSLVLRTGENSDVFNTLDEIYLVFTSKK